MSDLLPDPPPPDPFKVLQRAFRRFQIVVLIGLVGMAALLWWRDRQDQAALHSLRRPIVALRDFKFLPVQRGNSDLSWQFVAYWENAGLTTARNTQTHIHYWTGPVAPGFSRKTPNDFGSTYFDLGARETINQPAFMVPAQAMVGAKASAGEMLVWGDATYHEAIPGGRPHITRFCYAITWIGGDPTNAATPLDVRANWCNEGNCTENECVTGTDAAATQ